MYVLLTAEIEITIDNPITGEALNLKDGDQILYKNVDSIYADASYPEVELYDVDNAIILQFNRYEFTYAVSCKEYTSFVNLICTVE